MSLEQVEAKRVSAFDSMVKHQLVDVNRQFKELMAGENGKAPYLTFALSHHLLTVLNTTGFDNLTEILYKRSEVYSRVRGGVRSFFGHECRGRGQ